MLIQLMRKKSIQNGIWLYAMQIFNSVVPLLTLPYVARIFPPEEYGYFSLALNYISYIVVVVEYGFNMTGARKVAISQSLEEESQLFTIILLVRSALCLVCSIGILIYCIIDGFTILSRCMIVLMLMFIGTVLDQTWYFQGKQDMKFIAIANMVSRTLSAVLIFLCVNDTGDLIVYCLLYSAVNFLNGLIATGVVCGKFGLRIQRLPLSQFREDVVEGWYLFTSTFSSKVLSSLGITFLGWFSTSYDCGIFSALYRIPTMFLLVWNPISQVLYPISCAKMVDSFQEGSKFVRKMQRACLALFAIVCLFFCLFAKLFVGLLLGDSYATYYYVIYPLFAWLLVAIYNNFLGVQTLLAAGYSKEYSSCIRWSAVVSIIGNLVGIYFWGIMGAAFAPLISEIAMTAFLQKKKKKHSKGNDSIRL